MSVPARFRRLPGLLGAALLAPLLLLAACASSDERWAEVGFRDISFRNLYHTVADMLDAEGYGVASRDPASGRIESAWQYGTSLRELRGPSRRKAFANIEAAEDGTWTVRVRVAEEVIRKGGLLATQVRHSKDWEEYEDNFDEAELLAAKIRALLAEHASKILVSAPHEDGES